MDFTNLKLRRAHNFVLASCVFQMFGLRVFHDASFVLLQVISRHYRESWRQGSRPQTVLTPPTPPWPTVSWHSSPSHSSARAETGQFLQLVRFQMNKCIQPTGRLTTVVWMKFVLNMFVNQTVYTSDIWRGLWVRCSARPSLPTRHISSSPTSPAPRSHSPHLSQPSPLLSLPTPSLPHSLYCFPSFS